MSEDQAPETPPADAANASAGIGDLVAGIIRDLQDIVRGEIRLAKAELKADATAAARGAGFLVGGAVVGLVGFLILMLAVAYLIAVWLPLWAATGIVALALLALAPGLAVLGKRRLSSASLTPEQTIESLREDEAWASRQISSVKK